MTTKTIVKVLIVFRLTAQVEYAYVALRALASGPRACAQLTLAEIAEERGLSKKFMLQVLTDLRRSGLVESRRGKHGGYSLSTRAEEITFAQILAATAGTTARDRTDFEIAGADSFLAAWWRSVLDQIGEMGHRTTLAHALEAEQEATTQPMYYI